MVRAPQDFSLIRNPDAVVAFIGELRKCLDSRKRVWVVLKEVTNIDYDAIVVLLSAMVRFKSEGIPFNGDFPKDGKNKQLLADSGFFENLFKRFFLQDQYDLAHTGSNYISTHGQKIVSSELSSRILSEASEAVWGEPRRCLGVQTALVELMQNTFNHAVPMKEGERHWWLSVNHDETENKVRFSFVDYGVGIFQSLSSKSEGNKFFGAVHWLKQKFKYRNNAELLRLILHGELHKTVTEEYFRGQGLPGLLDCLNENWFSNLHVISNEVYAAVSEDRYRVMTSSLLGTFVYWEVTPQNASIEN